MQVYSWRFTIPALARHHRVIAVDLPGFGASDKPENFDTDLPGFARWILSLMDKLEIPRIALVGHSMGGSICYTIATMAPERVSSLTLVDAVGYQPRRSRFYLFRLMAIPWVGELIMATLTRIAVRVNQRWFLYNDKRFVTENGVSAYLTPLRSPGGAAAALRTIRRIDFDAAPGPSPCRVPTLILWGAQDRIVSPSDAEFHARDIPGAKLHLFEACGHNPQEEKADSFNMRVLEFLSQHA
jgi:pimeloyl-ACP methyl ester carboxylesterase